MADEAAFLELRDAAARRFGKPHRVVGADGQAPEARDRRAQRKRSDRAVGGGAHDGLLGCFGEPRRTAGIDRQAQRLDALELLAHERELPVAQHAEHVGRLEREPHARAVRRHCQRHRKCGAIGQLVLLESTRARATDRPGRAQRQPHQRSDDGHAGQQPLPPHGGRPRRRHVAHVVGSLRKSIACSLRVRCRAHAREPMHRQTHAEQAARRSRRRRPPAAPRRCRATPGSAGAPLSCSAPMREKARVDGRSVVRVAHQCSLGVIGQLRAQQRPACAGVRRCETRRGRWRPAGHRPSRGAARGFACGSGSAWPTGSHCAARSSSRCTRPAATSHSRVGAVRSNARASTRAGACSSTRQWRAPSMLRPHAPGGERVQFVGSRGRDDRARSPDRRRSAWPTRVQLRPPSSLRCRPVQPAR